MATLCRYQNSAQQSWYKGIEILHTHCLQFGSFSPFFHDTIKCIFFGESSRGFDRLHSFSKILQLQGNVSSFHNFSEPYSSLHNLLFIACSWFLRHWFHEKKITIIEFKIIDLLLFIVIPAYPAYFIALRSTPCLIVLLMQFKSHPLSHRIVLDMNSIYSELWYWELTKPPYKHTEKATPSFKYL